jgi:hypothetical protein
MTCHISALNQLVKLSCTLRLPSSLDEPEHGHQRRRKEPKQTPKHEFKELRYPAILKNEVTTLPIPQSGQDANAYWPQQDEAKDGEHQSAQSLLCHVRSERALSIK